MNKKVISAFTGLIVIIGGATYTAKDVLVNEYLCNEYSIQLEEKFDNKTLLPIEGAIYKQMKKDGCPLSLSPALKIRLVKADTIITEGNYALFYTEQDFADKKTHIRTKFKEKELDIPVDEALETQGTIAIEADRLLKSNNECILPIIQSSTPDEMFYNIMNNNC